MPGDILPGIQFDVIPAAVESGDIITLGAGIFSNNNPPNLLAGDDGADSLNVTFNENIDLVGMTIGCIGNDISIVAGCDGTVLVSVFGPGGALLG